MSQVLELGVNIVEMYASLLMDSNPIKCALVNIINS